MQWVPVTQAMLQSEDSNYQISRGNETAGKFTYRAWYRPENAILTTVQCFNESGDRAAAVVECKEACEKHAASHVV